MVLVEALVETGLPGKELEKGAGVALAASSKTPSDRAVTRGKSHGGHHTGKHEAPSYERAVERAPQQPGHTLR